MPAKKLMKFFKERLGILKVCEDCRQTLSDKLDGIKPRKVIEHILASNRGELHMPDEDARLGKKRESGHTAGRSIIALSSARTFSGSLFPRRNLT
eukprot:m.731539 g.731539  ORF g.731539 m.731539 type:complete len:95 (+) comp58872_c0_seq13:231-515(+)